MLDINKKYARLLAKYSLSLQPGERVLIRTTLLAEPLVRELYREVIECGAVPFVWFEMEGENQLLTEKATPEQLAVINPLYKEAVENFEAYIYIRAPYDTTEASAPPRGGEEGKRIARLYAERTGNRSLKRNLCEYPTPANAALAGTSLEEHAKFIYNACYLFDDNPEGRWLGVRAYQQNIVDHLNRCTQFRYLGKGIDISFNTEGRRWINSDGQTNMPSGEVYTSPVEDSVNGTIHFTYPVVYQGEEVEGITLWVKDGEIYRWEARKGVEMLDRVFQLPGARRFGEAAIGTNRNIQRFTKNILFDEKIGGTVHMAIGQSYLIAGGKNESSIHWDMIADMTDGGEIYADGHLIYRNGEFLI